MGSPTPHYTTQTTTSSAVASPPNHHSDNDDGLYGKAAFFAMMGIALVILLASLDQTIVSTAMPRIVSDLHGFDLYPWIATSYLLTSTITVPVLGKLGDLYGRKPFLMAAVVIFLVASMLAGMAGSMLFLIIARGIQGIGAGMFISTALASVGDLFPQPERRARWQGMLTGMFGLGSVVGPTLGGVLTDTLGWRSVFYINLPVGILAVSVMWFNLPSFRPTHTKRVTLDWLGIATITLAITSLLLTVEMGGDRDQRFSPLVIGMAAVSLMLWAAFIFIERRAEEPLMPLDMYAQRAVALCSLISFLSGFALFSLVYYTPLFVQGSLGLSASAAGFIQTPLVACMAAGSLASGQLFARTGRSRALMLAGTLILLTGSLLLTQVTREVNHLLLSIELAMCGMGVGILFPILYVIVQSNVPRNRLGVGTSSVQFLRLIGSTISTVIVGTLIATLFAAHLDTTIPAGTDSRITALLRDPQTLVNPENQAQLAALVQRVGGDQPAALAQLLDISREALAISIRSNYIIVVVTAVILNVLVLMLDSKAHQRKTPVAVKDTVKDAMKEP